MQEGGEAVGLQARGVADEGGGAAQGGDGDAEAIEREEGMEGRGVGAGSLEGEGWGVGSVVGGGRDDEGGVGAGGRVEEEEGAGQHLHEGGQAELLWWGVDIVWGIRR